MRLLVGAVLAASLGCAPQAEKRRDRCLPGTIATASGCAPVPDWDPWARDAAVKDAAAADVGMEIDAAHPTPDAGVARDAEVVPEPDAGPATPSVVGDWGVRVTNVQLVESDFVQETVVTITVLSIATLDASLGMSTTYCAQTGSEFGGVTTSYPAGALDAIVMHTQTATASGTNVGASFSMTRTRVLGWRTTNDPMSGNLPEDEFDWRVRDDDGDGEPGVSLDVAGSIDGQIFVVRRSDMQASGTWVTQDRIEGTSVTDQEQNVIGATNEFLTYGATWSQAIPDQSTFEMVRLPEGTDCVGLVDMQDALF